MRIALVQTNPVIGDLDANSRAIIAAAHRAHAHAADLVAFPELSVCGYPPRDLILQQGFAQRVRDAVLHIAHSISAPAVLVGAPWRPPPGFYADEWADDAPLTNSALLLRAGRVEARYDKRLLPTYDVFDEDRYFTPGDRPLVFDVAGLRVGVGICEDLWRGDDVNVSDRYRSDADPVAQAVQLGASLIVSPSASPFVLGKGPRQRDILTRAVRRHRVAVASVNQVGGNDDLLFDGHAALFVPDHAGAAHLIAAGPGFEEAAVYADLDPPNAAARPAPRAVPDPLLTAPEESLLWRALVMGVRDYCRKTGFTSCVLGLSGGIDSALTACIAAAALGPDRVLGVGLPTRYSSQGSIDDARELARRLNLRWQLVPLQSLHAATEHTLTPLYAALSLPETPGIAEENAQSRLRGLVLMAISNKSGSILLTTGNKSEVAVGYCTLYGDMNGGLAVLSDITKLQVYRLARWLNSSHAHAGFAQPPIPESSLTKPPSAELRPDQTDQDSLPPYEQLDQIIERYIDRRMSTASIIRETGFDPAVVARITRMIDAAEYKRKQMATGLKVSDITFGPGRRWPIAHRYRDLPPT
ncbi:MAG: NAD+ synthase [Planctomycetota bacterium]|nr:NAD+ synthase [Planctomycetota bacterium]